MESYVCELQTQNQMLKAELLEMKELAREQEEVINYMVEKFM